VSVKEKLRHPFWQTVLIVAVSWLVFEFGIAFIPPIFRIRSAPAPGSVVLQYMAVVIVGMLLYMSSDEARWERFKQPIQAVLVDNDKRILRLLLLIAIPVLAGFVAFDRVRPTVEAPPPLRSIHPAPPSQITFRGKTMMLSSLENPLRKTGDQQQHYEVGKEVYYKNCLPCHGDALDGRGHWAHAFNPAPLNFRDNGTIAQLTESFVFWRIAKGGPGLPKEGTPWNSAMPAWEDFLTENEIWSVIIFLYQQTGWHPRPLEAHGGGEH
jgi:cbb3-type cytochrome c oxidase subunit III